MKVLADVCPLCEGTGWKSVSIGSERRVTRCDCRLQARAQTLLAAARIPRRYEHCELSNFDSTGPTVRWHRRVCAACKFVEEYPVDSTGLLLIGSIGVGKTHLAVGIIKELILRQGHRLPVLRLPRIAQADSELLQRFGEGHGIGRPAPGVRNRSAGARRTRRRQTHGVGVGHGQPHPQHALQRQSHHHHHHQFR